MAARKNSNSSTQLIQELEALSQSLYQSHTATTTARRTASLALPRTSAPSLVPPDEAAAAPKGGDRSGSQTRSRRMSLSPWRSRPKPDYEQDGKGKDPPVKAIGPGFAESKKFDDKAGDRKGIWNWKPMRALSHIGMQKLGCLFSVEVVSVQGLPPSMNGLRLSVCVRKKETKDGAVQTMPSRVSQGAADFEETLFVKCNVYCTPGAGKQLKFEPRPYVIYVFAVDANELDFGKSLVDISQLIQESMEKNVEGMRIRQWDVSFGLSGKAKGGELVLKLGFQVMEKVGGIGIYSQGEGSKVNKTTTFSPSSFGWKQSKTSFSIPSPRLQSRSEACTPSQLGSIADIQGMDDLNLDEPAPAASETSVEKSEEPDSKAEDIDLPDFEVVDKGVEIEDREEESVATDEIGDGDEKSGSATSEVVKEVVVQDPSQFSRLTELDSIAQQIKALESMIADEKVIKIEDQPESQGLDADEESVTLEFLQMLEGEEGTGTAEYSKSSALNIPPLQLEGLENPNDAEHETKVFVPDLGKGLGCVVQTRNGGYLAAVNPLDVEVAQKDNPKLALQISRPVVLVLPKVSFPSNGLELFQRIAALGIEDLSAKLSTLMPLEDLLGKTAEQIAFEGIASTIIQGRNKEGASSSAARVLSTVKNMAAAMNSGRKERISTGLWNMPEEPLTPDEILASSLQKLESMSIEGLKIQAGMGEEDSPFDVSPTFLGDHPLSSTIPLEGWSPPTEPSPVVVVAMIQLRDPLRRYESVGGPMLAVIQAAGAERTSKSGKEDDETKYKVTSLHVGGLMVGGGKKSARDGERQRLTGMQWLVANGVGKQVKKRKPLVAAGKGKELLWGVSSRVMADMWLKPTRNPDVNFSKS